MVRRIFEEMKSGSLRFLRFVGHSLANRTHRFTFTAGPSGESETAANNAILSSYLASSSKGGKAFLTPLNDGKPTGGKFVYEGDGFKVSHGPTVRTPDDKPNHFVISTSSEDISKHPDLLALYESLVVEEEERKRRADKSGRRTKYALSSTAYKRYQGNRG